MSKLIIKYFSALTSKQQEQFEQIGGLYAYWNERINVISRKDMEHFYEHHVLHSLAIAKYVTFNKDATVMDAGTGGGFPGIPLAILFPETKFYLVDSIGKKMKVVNEVIHTLELDNVEAVQMRMEQVNKSFDFVVSRAVTDLEKFTLWTIKRLKRRSVHEKKNGILYLKGMDIKDEIDRVKRMKGIHVTTYPLRNYFEEPFFSTKQLVHVHH